MFRYLMFVECSVVNTLSVCQRTRTLRRSFLVAGPRPLGQSRTKPVSTVISWSAEYFYLCYCFVSAHIWKYEGYRAMQSVQDTLREDKVSILDIRDLIHKRDW